MDANNGPHIKIVDPAAAAPAATSIDTKFASFSKEQAAGDFESIFDEETVGRRDTDYKRKQVRTGFSGCPTRH
jgi:hypothetical protein